MHYHAVANRHSQLGQLAITVVVISNHGTNVPHVKQRVIFGTSKVTSLMFTRPSSEINYWVLLNFMRSGTHWARYTDVRINGHLAQFKTDSEAEVTVVSPSFPGLPHLLDEVKSEVCGPGNLRLRVLRTFTATLHWHNRVTVQTLYVVKNEMAHFLGLLVIENLGFVQFLNSIKSIPSTHPKIFRRLRKVRTGGILRPPFS